MTKKIGVSLPDDLYEWAAGEVRAGRADSVSALVAEGIRVLRGYADVEALLRDLAADVAEDDQEIMARVEAAERSADAAYRKRLARKAGGGHAA